MLVDTVVRRGRRQGATSQRWHLAPADAASGITVTQPPAELRDSVRPRSLRTSLKFATRQGDVLFADAAKHGEVFRYVFPGGPESMVVLCNPEHIKSVMTADPDVAPSATRHSPLRPILGPSSVLTSIGTEHRRQRALLMPRFHGEAVASFRAGIESATAARIEAWPLGRTIRLADLAQRLTLDVIMSAVFGLPDGQPSTDAERALHTSILRLLRLSVHPVAMVAQLSNSFHENPVGITKLMLRPVDAAITAVLAERRAAGCGLTATGGRTDIATLLLTATTEDGIPLPDSEIRDQLITMVLAGHETTANTVAWTFERLTRTPRAYHDARDAADASDDDYLNALLNESMRARPVIPTVGRELLVPFEFGECRVEPGSTAAISILLLHHRDDLYPQPFRFDPQRFLGVRPASHTLLPFGGGNRRCLGATLAMAELKIVVTEILRRVELELTDRRAERPRHRNVTMIPADGGLVQARAIQ